MSPSKGMDITDRSTLGNITPGDSILNASMNGTQEVEFWSRKFPVFQDGGEQTLDVSIHSDGYVSIDGKVHYTRLYDIAKIAIANGGELKSVPTQCLYSAYRRNLRDVGNRESEFWLREDCIQEAERIKGKQHFTTEIEDITAENIAKDVNRFWNSDHGSDRPRRQQIFNSLYKIKPTDKVISIFKMDMTNTHLGYAYLVELTNGLQVCISPDTMRSDMPVQIMSMYSAYLDDIVKIYGNTEKYELVKGTRDSVETSMISKYLAAQVFQFGHKK